MTGGAATISEKILKSKQMKAARKALERDHVSTEDLQNQIQILTKNQVAMKGIISDMAKSGGKLTWDSLSIAGLLGASSSSLFTKGQFWRQSAWPKVSCCARSHVNKSRAQQLKLKGKILITTQFQCL